MIPRFKPPIGWPELSASIRSSSNDPVGHFEEAFAQEMQQKHAVAFAYSRTGLKNFCSFLGSYSIRATLFIVGRDLVQQKNHAPVLAAFKEGHEIANHTMNHRQGFRLLSTDDKEKEIAGMEKLCVEMIGQKQVGFRSPGWNTSDDTFPLLRSRGYIYDSSIFPTPTMPLLKFLHWRMMCNRDRSERTTLGRMKYIFAPVSPYRMQGNNVLRKGHDPFVEFPVTVSPFFRLPFLATFLLAGGMRLFKVFYRSLRMLSRPIHFQFHLSDFIDYSHKDLVEAVPRLGRGQYVPHALRVSLPQKLATFRAIIDIISTDYAFATLRELAQEMITS